MLPTHLALHQKPLAGCRFSPLLAALGLAALAAAPVGAAAGRTPIDASQAHLAKASSHLLRARALALEGQSPSQMSAALPGLRLRDERLDVEIKLSSFPSGLVEELAELGVEVESAHPSLGLVYGRLDAARLARLTARPEVLVVRQKPRVGRRAGAATNQGDLAMATDTARTDLGFDGTGVIVGILSDSYNATLGGSETGGACDCLSPGSTCLNVVTGMANQTSGDLPPSAVILDDCTAGPAFCNGLLDEGAAMGELLTDVAPGSGQLFHSAFNSPGDFAEGITELYNCGADVIVDDVFWTGQPFFQDGPIAHAAQGVFDAGVPYFSAAGNDATFGIQDFFSDAEAADNMDSVPNGDDFHEFAPGDSYAEITVPDGCEIFAELQWSEPFAGTGVGAASDLDLYILSSPADPASTAGANILASSTTAQGCGDPPAPSGHPLEAAAYENLTGSSDTVFLAIEHYCGDKSVEMRVVTISFDCSTRSAGWDFEDGEMGENPIFVDPQIFGHPAARGAIAVGASFFGEILGGGGFLPGGIDPPPGQLNVEPFNSLGGSLPFYFDASGSPAPETRTKPEITGPDGGNTTFFGTDIGFDPDTDRNFFGTSAAAPNAAALAALILDATDGNLNPLPLRQILQQAVIDMETPGPDSLSGDGLVQGPEALRSIDDAMTPLLDNLEFSLSGGSFLKTPMPTLQPLQANDSLVLEDGDFGGVVGSAGTIIIGNGFNSGAASSWGHN